MGELHINIWRENVEEGIEVTFVQDGFCRENGKPRYELAFRTKSGSVISFWTCDPDKLEALFAQALVMIAKSGWESCAKK
jgi:hypothetical protein